MSEPPKTQVTIRDFAGLVLLQDALDIPDGAAQRQVNVRSHQIGRLDPRLGLGAVTFDAPPTIPTS